MVNKTLMLMHSCIKKSYKQMILISVLTILASIMLNIVFVVKLDYRKNFKRQMEEQNSSSFVSVYYDLLNTDHASLINDSIKDNENISSYEIENVITGNGTVNFNDGLFSNIITLMSYEDASNKKLDKFDVYKSDDNIEGIYVSHIFDITYGMKIGDPIKIKVFNETLDFKIAGFYNSVSSGTINCTDFCFLVSSNLFNQIYTDSLSKGYRISIKLKDCDEKIEKTNIIDKINHNNFLLLLDTQSVSKIETARYTNSSMFEAIMIVACVIIVIVLLSIIAIVLTNYIKKNVVSFGTLKAMGYTSNTLIIPLVIVFLVLSFLFSSLGVLLSYPILPTINNALETQTGIPYEVRFLFVPFLLTIAICIALTLVTSYLSIRKIRRISPINAIRETSSKKINKGNVFNFDKTKLKINSAIGLNNMISGISRTIILFLSYIAIGFLLAFSTFIYENTIVDSSYAVNLVCGQVSDSVITVKSTNEEKLTSVLKDDERVSDYYLYTTVSICPNDLEKIVSYVIEKDSSSIDESFICIKGNMPRGDNEIAVNNYYARIYNLKIGDKLHFGNDSDIDFTITGITQGAYHAGYDSYITKEGYQRIENINFLSYYVVLNKDVDINEFNDDISSKCECFNIVNQKLYLDSLVPLYCMVLNILGVVIIIICILISCFVLYILLSIMLDNKRREHGILKSIGFTSKDILIQTEISTVPECLIGTVIGLLLARKGSGFLISSALRNSGIAKFGQPVNSLYLLICGIILTIFTTLFIIFLSRSIKKISPHQLFNRE